MASRRTSWPVCRHFLTRSAKETVKSAEPFARKSLELDVSDAGAHAIAGWVALTRGDLDAALEEAEQALVLSPNNANSHRLMGQAMVFSGKHHDGLEVLSRYLRFNPHDPRNWTVHHLITIACYLTADYSGAVDAAKRTIRANSKQPMSYRWLVAALGQMSKVKEAHDVLRDAADKVAPGGP